MRKYFQQLKFSCRNGLIILVFTIFLGTSSTNANSNDIPNGGILPSWSPDSKKIGFISSNPHNSGSLWIMNSDGSEAHKLPIGDVSDYSWSKEGQKIRYIAYRNGSAHLLEYALDNKETIAWYLLGKPISLLPEDVTE